MANVSAISNSSSSATDPARVAKLTHAAHQFEAVLLNSVFGALEHSFSTLGKEKKEDASDRYHFLGMQALASQVASHGGLGIADFIIRNVMRSENNGNTPVSPQAKSLSKGASLERLSQRADRISFR
jgi:Rod binding domain-containing protein